MATKPTSATAERRKVGGAFFTPPAIAHYLARWAVGNDPDAIVLDPTCGEAVFLLAAGRRLQELGRSREQLEDQVFGVEVDQESLRDATRLLDEEGLDAHLIAEDFFALHTPAQLGAPIPPVDAVIGNPPFVRYQHHTGDVRKRAISAALAQGVQLSGLASSWAATLVHACGFLKPQGRIAMVLPEELLTVQYAEPVRRWLRKRFAAVHLVMFEQLQFEEALEKVVLLVAQGTGGCDACSLYQVSDADDLPKLRPFDHLNITPASEGKWTDALLTSEQRQAFRVATGAHFVPLSEYGAPELGTVTGSNAFFALSEATRKEFALGDEQLVRISPPGTRHLQGLSFTDGEWEALRADGQAVWLLHPAAHDVSPGLLRYVEHGVGLGVDAAYKCRIRTPWWRPPLVPTPDLFFTYMSHRYPRLVRNAAGVALLNSMHGVRLKEGASKVTAQALPLLTLNSVTMLGAELHGRSYGGGILKMEPREAAQLPVPAPAHLGEAWRILGDSWESLDQKLRSGEWSDVVQRVDEALLSQVVLPQQLLLLRSALEALRGRRLG